MRKYIGALLRKLLPQRMYRLLANGAIVVPAYYGMIIRDAEKYFGYSLLNSNEKDIMLVRKYAHIIDKGLHRIDAEPGHSVTIASDLKRLLHKLEKTNYSTEPTYLWAKEKLERYELLQKNPEMFVPLHEPEKETTITYDTLFELIQQRRSNRQFRKERLQVADIERLKVVSNWAANSCNKQPIRLFVTDEPAVAKKCLQQCKGGTGFSDYIPSFWVFAADCRAYVWPSEMYLPMIDVSLGAQNVFLAAETLGLSGTILSWAQKNYTEEYELRKLLNIPDTYMIIFCAVLGYADIKQVIPQRKNVE